MDYDAAMAAYLAEIDQPHGPVYAAAVRRFQQGFLKDRVTRDCDEAFRRAVDTCARLLPAIRAAA